VLAVGDPLIDLVVSPMLPIDQLLPLLDFFGVVLLHVSGLHLGRVGFEEVLQ